MLRYVVRRYATLWDVTLRCEMLRYVVRCYWVVYAMLWDVTLRCKTLRLFSSDAFFLRTFTYVCSIRVNEQVYVFWALRTYTYVEKNTSLENSLYTSLRCKMLRYILRCCATFREVTFGFEMLRYVEIRYAFKQKVLSCFGMLIIVLDKLFWSCGILYYYCFLDKLSDHSDVISDSDQRITCK